MNLLDTETSARLVLAGPDVLEALEHALQTLIDVHNEAKDLPYPVGEQIDELQRLVDQIKGDEHEK